MPLPLRSWMPGRTTSRIGAVAAVWDETQASGQPTVWITHAGVIRAATMFAQGIRRLERADQWPLAAPGFGQWRMQWLPT